MSRSHCISYLRGVYFGTWYVLHSSWFSFLWLVFLVILLHPSLALMRRANEVTLGMYVQCSLDFSRWRGKVRDRKRRGRMGKPRAPPSVPKWTERNHNRLPAGWLLIDSPPQIGMRASERGDSTRWILEWRSDIRPNGGEPSLIPTHHRCPPQRGYPPDHQGQAVQTA